MKILIIAISLFSFSIYAQVDVEPSWKSKARDLISKVAGSSWSDKILGPKPIIEPEIKMPIIPKDFKTTTDVNSYTRVTKEPTEFDRLPADRKRQFDYKFLEELFYVTRKTEAKDEDLSNWLNTLDQGGSREGIYQALVLDDVYAALENIEEKPSSRLVDFTVTFSQKFLDQKFKPESLDQFNVFTLKRIVTEKALDLLEYYEGRDLEAIHNWYAIFSHDLASSYGPLLKSPIRSEPSMRFHQEWAKGMPIQHIKSEIIIKIHMVMNGLQHLQ